jgi:hypothetical protein
MESFLNFERQNLVERFNQLYRRPATFLPAYLAEQLLATLPYDGDQLSPPADAPEGNRIWVEEYADGLSQDLYILRYEDGNATVEVPLKVHRPVSATSGRARLVEVLTARRAVRFTVHYHNGGEAFLGRGASQEDAMPLADAGMSKMELSIQKSYEASLDVVVQKLTCVLQQVGAFGRWI